MALILLENIIIKIILNTYIKPMPKWNINFMYSAKTSKFLIDTFFGESMHNFMQNLDYDFLKAEILKILNAWKLFTMTPGCVR